MTQTDTPTRDILVTWAFWLNVFLVVLAVPLSAFYLLLLTQASNPPLSAGFPIVYAVIAMLHMSCLSREFSDSAPVRLAFHGVIAVSGVVSLIALFAAIATDTQGGVFFPFVVIGGVISFAVCRSFFARLRGLSFSRQPH